MIIDRTKKQNKPRKRITLEIPLELYNEVQTIKEQHTSLTCLINSLLRDAVNNKKVNK